MIKPNIYVLIGPAGSGKSTEAERMGHRVFSSDEYRMEMFGSLEQGRNGELFDMLHKDIIHYVEETGNDAIFDATNLSRKKRAAFYGKVNGRAKVINVHFHLNLEDLLRNNEKREGERRVPDEVVRKMFKRHEISRVGVDCDFARVIDQFLLTHTKDGVVSHNSPYHAESINEHISNAVRLAKTDALREVAAFHDLGKFYVAEQNDKDMPAANYFRSVNGGLFHQFMGHQNISALIYASYNPKALAGQPNSKAILEAIFQHMAAHDGLSKKVIERNKLTEEEIQLIKDFAVIDDKAGIKDGIIYETYQSLLGKKE